MRERDVWVFLAGLLIGAGILVLAVVLRRNGVFMIPPGPR